MTVIFCVSNMAIPQTLSIILKDKVSDYIVYTDQENIYEFFNYINLKGIKIIFKKPFYIKRLRDLYSIKKHNKNVLNKILKLQPTKFIFFHDSFAEIIHWIIKRSNIQSYFCPVNCQNPFKKKKSLNYFKTGILKKLIYNITYLPYWTGERYVYFLRKSFFQKYAIKPLRVDVDFDLINSLTSSKFSFGLKKTVLLSGSVVELNQVNENEYLKKINDLIDFIGQDNLVIKSHPRFLAKYGKENELNEIPSFIPANLLLNYFDNFIGYSTMTLAEAANAGKSAISLLYYFEPNNLERVSFYKKYLESNTNSSIKFIKSLNELE